MNARDLALQGLTPTVMVPAFETMACLDRPGHRFLVSRNGLWIELRRAWLHARLPVALQDAVPMPYGEVTQVVDLSCGRVPKELLDEFIGQARDALPNECGAVVAWHERTGAFRLVPLHALEASPGHLKYEPADLEEGEHLVLDLHSHGKADAFFSRTDNRDDIAAVKIAGVVGKVDQPNPSFAFRLCALGQFVKM